jgi:hypothetical protein
MICVRVKGVHPTPRDYLEGQQRSDHLSTATADGNPVQALSVIVLLALAAAVPIALFYMLIGYGLKVGSSQDPPRSSDMWARSFISDANIVQTGYSLAFLGAVGLCVLIVGATAGSRLDSPQALEMWQKAGTTRRARLIVLGTMWAMIGVSAAVLVLGVFGGALAGSALARAIAGPPGGDWLDTGRALDALVGGLRTWYVVMTYLTLTGAIAMWTRNRFMGVAIGWLGLLGELIGGELLQRSGASAARFLFALPYHNAMATLAANGTVEDLVVKRRELLPTALQGSLVLTCYAALAMSLMVLNYVRLDLPPVAPLAGRVQPNSGDESADLTTDPHLGPSPGDPPPAPQGT